MGNNTRDGNLDKMGICTVTIDPPSCVASTTTSMTTAVIPGLEVNDLIHLTKPALSTGVGIMGADPVAVAGGAGLLITFMNASIGAVDPPSEVYRLLWMRPVTPSATANLPTQVII